MSYTTNGLYSEIRLTNNLIQQLLVPNLYSRVSITGNLLVNLKNSFKLNEIPNITLARTPNNTKTTNNSNNPKAAE